MQKHERASKCNGGIIALQSYRRGLGSGGGRPWAQRACEAGWETRENEGVTVGKGAMENVQMVMMGRVRRSERLRALLVESMHSNEKAWRARASLLLFC